MKYEVRTPSGDILFFNTKADILRHIGTKNSFNLWRHLKRDEARPDTRFKANTFLGHIVTLIS